jgi:hypothetical protein
MLREQVQTEKATPHEPNGRSNTSSNSLAPRGTRVQRRRRGMMIAGQRTRGFQAPVGRHVAPPELARIGGAGSYQHDTPLELPFSFKGAIGSCSVSRSKRNRKLPPAGAGMTNFPRSCRPTTTCREPELEPGRDRKVEPQSKRIHPFTESTGAAGCPAGRGWW